MASIRVAIMIGASPESVWHQIRDIGSHVDWMADAESIRFTSAATSGVGTTFECATRFGPIRLVDVMEITEWSEEQTMGVRHTGVVTGTGRFTLHRERGGSATLFTWTEQLRFPWWMGGPLGARLGAPVMHLVWTRNLRRLKEQVEAGR